MKSFLKSLKQQDGFTLVELMVVVAIIGILSAVAIPNFKKYQAKAKVSEAKLQLSALYMAMSSFYSDYNVYGGCLPYMGYNPETERATRYYSVGFAAAPVIPAVAYTAAQASGLAGCAATATGSTVGPSQSLFVAGKGTGAVISSTVVGSAYDGTNGVTFTAAAQGKIDTAGFNQHTINQNKQLVQTSLGY